MLELSGDEGEKSRIWGMTQGPSSRCQGKPGCVDEQGDQPRGRTGGSVPCRGNYTQLLEGEKPPRGPRMSSSPSSKGDLETFLSPKSLHMPDSAFQKSIELLKTLMKTGNVVLIRGVFFQSPLGSAVTQKEPNAGMNHLDVTTITLGGATSAGPLPKKFGGPPGEGVGRTPVECSGQTSLVGTEERRVSDRPREAEPQPAPARLCLFISSSLFLPSTPRIDT